MRLLTGLVAIIAAVSLIPSQEAQASATAVDQQLDLAARADRARLARDLPATLIVRVNKLTGEFEVFNSYTRLGKASHRKVAKARYTKMTAKSRLKGHPRSKHFADAQASTEISWSPLSWILGFTYDTVDTATSWANPYYQYGGYTYPYNYYDSYDNYEDGYTYNYYGNPFFSTGW